MRARTQSVAHLPATSVIATAVLTIAWWLTLSGLTTETPGELVSLLAVATFGIVVATAGADPRIRACLANLVVALRRDVRQKPPPGVAVRWAHRRIVSMSLCSNEIEMTRVGRPRAPGRVAPTA